MPKPDQLRDAIQARIEPLPMTAAKQLASAVLDGATLGAIDLEVVADLVADPSDPDAAIRDRDAKLLVERGDAPGLSVLFEQATEDVDASWDEVSALLRQLCETAASSPDLRALALLFSRSSWTELVARSSALGANDRLGRLAQAAVALQIEGEEPLAFLRGEAARFFAMLHDETTDTAALAAIALLRRHDEPTIAALTEAVSTRPPHGAAGRALLGLIGEDPAFARPLAPLRRWRDALDAEIR